MDIDELFSIVTLKKLEDNKFEGQNYKTVWGRIFGGQVLSQSLHAAYQTVPENRIAHSMHAYFILPGDLNEPVIYEVDNIRNGGSFTTRRVVAFQKLSLIHISEPTRPIRISYAVFCLKKTFFNDTATTEIYTPGIVGSVRCV